MAGCDEQFLESGGPRDPEPTVPSGSARPLSDAVLPSPTTSAGAARPRRRRLKGVNGRSKHLQEQEVETMSFARAGVLRTRLILRASLFRLGVRSRFYIRRATFLLRVSFDGWDGDSSFREAPWHSVWVLDRKPCLSLRLERDPTILGEARRSLGFRAAVDIRTLQKLHRFVRSTASTRFFGDPPRAAFLAERSESRGDARSSTINKLINE